MVVVRNTTCQTGSPGEVAMSPVEELRELARKMDTLMFLRFLIAERFAQRTVVTCSLRGRSIVLLKMISEVDPSTPIVFCHAPELYPESQDYRSKLVSRLGLSDIREPADDEDGPVPGDCDHSEGLWAEDPVNHRRAYKVVHLNKTLASFDCWISGVYHGPYAETPDPMVTEEGRLIRINPLASWTRDQVRSFMKENGLPYHPRSLLRPQESAKDEPKSVPTYHY
jgi:phosphoadenosine phosphosulfate reductase